MSVDTLLIVPFVGIGLILMSSMLLNIWTLTRILLSKKWPLGPAVTMRRDWLKSKYGILVQGVGATYILAFAFGIFYIMYRAPEIMTDLGIIFYAIYIWEQMAPYYHPYFSNMSLWFSMVAVAFVFIGLGRIVYFSKKRQRNTSHVTLWMIIKRELMVPLGLLGVFLFAGIVTANIYVTGYVPPDPLDAPIPE